MPFLPLFLILAGAFLLLVTGRVHPDGVGLAVIVALILTGSASPAEAFAGFSHPATLTVAAVLIMSAGVQRTGVADGLALWLRRHAWQSEGRLLRLQSVVVAGVSAFVSNTATMAVFLPVTLSVSRDRNFSPSKFLIPLSFASILGGMCTAIGTSTNIVVASMAAERGMAPFRMFEFLPVGAILAVTGLLYLTTVGRRLVPARRPAEDLSTAYQLRKYLTEVEIAPRSQLAGLTLEAARLSELYDLDVLEIHRGPGRFAPQPRTELLERDVLLVRAPVAGIQRIQGTQGIRLRSEVKLEAGDLVTGGMVLAEAVVPPGSPLDGRSLKQSAFRNRYGVTALALYHHRENIRERVGRIPIRIGDVLLLYGPKTRLRELAMSTEVLSVVQFLPPRPRRKLARVSLLVVALTVMVAATGLLSLVKAVVGGAALMVLSGCLSLRETYRAVDRRTVFLIAGMISLGLAMERAGAAQRLARLFMERGAGLGPVGLLAATFVTTVLVTEFISNNACAVIMTPIAIAAARDFGLDPRPFVLAVAYGASASFLTPFGYQTNMFVYGPGGYRFTDFARVGLPLTLLALVVVLVFIPVFFPLVAAQ